MTQTMPRYEHVRDHVDLRLTRLGGHDVLDAINDRIENLENLLDTGFDADSEMPAAWKAEAERLRMVAWAIECQLNEVREVEA